MNATTTTATALADLRAKLTAPDPRDGITAINIDRRTRDVQTWPLRRDADVALRKLRERGLNVDENIRIQRARTTFGRPFVITRLGDLGETLLMTADGSWVPGLLYPERPGDNGAVWQPYEGAELIPPTFTHVTRTGVFAGQPDYTPHKSNGCDLAPRRGRASFAKCTCGWRDYSADTRDQAQAAARVHRAEAAA